MYEELNIRSIVSGLEADFKTAKETGSYSELADILNRYAEDINLLGFINTNSNEIADLDLRQNFIDAQALLFGLIRIVHVAANSQLEAENLPAYLKRANQIKKFPSRLKNLLRGKFETSHVYDVRAQINLRGDIHKIQATRNYIDLESLSTLTPDGGVIDPVIEVRQDDVHTLVQKGEMRNAQDFIWPAVAEAEKRVDEEANTSGQQDISFGVYQAYLGSLAAYGVLTMRSSQVTGEVQGFEDALLAFRRYYNALLNPVIEAEHQQDNLNFGRVDAVTREALIGIAVYPHGGLRKRLSIGLDALSLRSRVKKAEKQLNQRP